MRLQRYRLIPATYQSRSKPQQWEQPALFILPDTNRIDPQNSITTLFISGLSVPIPILAWQLSRPRRCKTISLVTMVQVAGRVSKFRLRFLAHTSSPLPFDPASH